MTSIYSPEPLEGLIVEPHDVRATGRAEIRAEPDSRLLRSIEPACPRQRRRALWLCLAIGLIALACLPVAKLPRPHYPDFFAAYQTGLIAAFLISTYLLFALYRGNRSPSLLFLCAGGLYTGAILALQLLSYPGMLTPAGLFPGGAQATVWLWLAWHAVLPGAIALYAIAERFKPGWTAAQPDRIAARFGALCLTLIAATGGALMLHAENLPALGRGVEDLSELATLWPGPALLMHIVLALLVLWRATALRTQLQVWLGVALLALLFDAVMTISGGARFSVGWYVGQGDALIAAAVMLLICMGEINRAYLRTTNSVRRLATANALLEAKVDQAGLDHLTGLPGRALFLQRVRALRARNVNKGMIVAVMLVDLDGFKRVNDTFGHERGDQILKSTADVLRSVLRDTDVAGRFGGDEFLVCLFAPFAVVQSVVIQIAGRIVSGVGQLGSGIGCSVGVSLYNADRLNLEHAMQQADEAMYLAKDQGKNRYVIHGQPHVTVPPRRLSA